MIKADPGWYVLYVQKKGRAGNARLTPVVGWDENGLPICNQQPGSGFSGSAGTKHMTVRADDVDPVSGRSFEDMYQEQQRLDIQALRGPRQARMPPAAVVQKRKPWQR